MITVHIAEVAQRRGIESGYALSKALEVSPTIGNRLWKGEFDKIGIGTLDRLCMVLRCQPNLLFKHVADADAE